MTPKQFFSRLQTSFRDLVWEGTSNKIFGDAVFIVPRLPMQQLMEFPAPSCFIVEGGFTCDREHPGIIEQKFTIIFFIEVPQESFGETVLTGANREPNTSNGAGMFDLSEEVLNFLLDTTTLTTKLLLVEKSAPQAIFVKSNQPAIFRNLTCLVTLGVY